MVVGVEVAVGGVSGITRLRGPHPVAHLQVATERDDVGAGDRSAERGVAVQRRTVDHEVRHTGRGVSVLHPRRVCALGRPDAARRVGEPLARVGEAFAERELPQPRIQQRLERVRQRAAEQFDGVRVDQLPQQRAAAVAPRRGELVERTAGLVVLANSERAHGFRCRVSASACAVRAAWPPRAPRSCQFATQCCMPVRQYGSSSWAVTTGVMPSVTRWRRPSAASVRSTRISGRYAAAHDWYSHSSPTGHRPWCASQGRWVCRTRVKRPGVVSGGRRRTRVTGAPRWRRGRGSRRCRARLRRPVRSRRWRARPRRPAGRRATARRRRRGRSARR